MIRFRTHLRPALAALLLGSALLFPSCRSVGTYVKDRALDLSDIIDVKYGFAVGIGAKVEASMYLGAGVGWATVYDCREWYGRRSVIIGEQTFLHLGLVGWDGTQELFDRGDDATDWYSVVLPINLGAIDHPDNPALLQRWRFGGEVLLPFVQLGLYLNLGEVADFILGLATIDIAADDGMSMNDKYPSGFSVGRPEAPHL